MAMLYGTCLGMSKQVAHNVHLYSQHVRIKGALWNQSNMAPYRLSAAFRGLPTHARDETQYAWSRVVGRKPAQPNSRALTYG